VKMKVLLKNGLRMEARLNLDEGVSTTPKREAMAHLTNMNINGFLSFGNKDHFRLIAADQVAQIDVTA
jgi:hypothetical protein